MIGQALGAYQVVAKLGEGGMGEVYRARDTKLQREVAIKVLPAALADDPQRRARMAREAQALAALNHPHIAHVYGLEESGGALAIVMELVEGPTLADLIAAPRPRSASTSTGGSGPRGRGLPIDEAIQIATQVADALEAAHAAGIVHRDLKPANIKVRPDGVVKVLDFGLARIVSPDVGASGVVADSPTLTVAAPMTAHGVILGTAAYMAPEQARGRVADARSDLWAFGVVLYEMLTGASLFTGKTTSDVLAALLRDEPDWTALPAETPPRVRTLLRRCLQKDPQRRLRHAGDARLELADTDAAIASGEPSSGRRGVGVLAALVALGCAASAGLTYLLAARPVTPPERPVSKWLIEYQASSANLHMGYRYPALSPDGRRVAYIDGSHLRIRDLDRLEPREVPIEGEVGMPTWSPDGTAVAFAVNNSSLWRIAVSGGAPTMLCDLPPGLVLGMAWQPTGRIVVNMVVPWVDGRLWTVPDTGGAAQPLTPEFVVKGWSLIWGLRGLPDGSLAYRLLGEAEGTIIEGAGKPPLRLEGNARWFTYAPSGHLLYEDGDYGDSKRPASSIYVSARPFDLDRRQVTGSPFRVATASISGAGPTASRDGTLVHEQLSLGRAQLVWVDRRGGVLGRIGEPQDFIAEPAVAPDGRRVAVLGFEGQTAANLWVHDVLRGTKTRITFDSGIYGDVAWNADGSRISFTGLVQLMASTPDGSDTHDVLPQRPQATDAPSSPSSHQWSRDGRYLAFTAWGRASRKDVWALETSSRAIHPVLHTAYNESNPTLSPDSRYVAYISDETGRPELFVQTFPVPGRKVQLSSGGAAFPRWSPRGDEIFYVAGRRLMSIAVKGSTELLPGEPQYLFDLDEHAERGRRFDTPDGQRFAIVRTVVPTRWRAVVIQNWFEEFRSK